MMVYYGGKRSMENREQAEGCSKAIRAVPECRSSEEM